MSEITVSLGKRSYSIIAAPGLLRQGDWLQMIGGNSVVVVTDEHVASLYLPSLVKRLQTQYEVLPITVPAGERHKNAETWLEILSAMLQAKLTRQVTVIALGGGVIGDMAGFAAACYQRGVDFIQVPTTLLAMVDSSVGGKTAINHPLGKNMIGAFYQPKAVLMDLDVLSSLPDREYAAGLAEVLKYGLIWDEKLLHDLMTHAEALQQRNLLQLEGVITRCCHIKAEIVGLDERESGVRAILNFGHTFGHAIEAVTEYKKYLHGEAIAIGMCLALKLCVQRHTIKPGVLAQVEQWLGRMGLPTRLPKNIGVDALWQAMQLDKKKDDKGLRFILLQHVGRAYIVADVTEDQVKSIL